MSRAVIEQSMEGACYKLLQEALPHAEWQDKCIYPVSQEAYQNWKLTIYLPVRLSETDKSPEAALARAALAEQAQPQPVAWIAPDALVWRPHESEKVPKLTRHRQNAHGFTVPLYSTPPAPVVPQPVEWNFSSFDDWWDQHGFFNAVAADQVNSKPLAKLAWDVGREMARPPAPQVADFHEGQWWLVELDAAARDGSNDLKRAVAVVRNLLRTAHAQPAPVVPQPLTEREMYEIEERARREFKLSQRGPKGQQITYWDSLTPWLIRAVEAAVLERMGVQR